MFWNMFFCFRSQIKVKPFLSLQSVLRPSPDTAFTAWLIAFHASVLFTALYPPLTLLNMMCRLSLTSCSCTSTSELLKFFCLLESRLPPSLPRLFDISLSVNTALPSHALLWELTGRLPMLNRSKLSIYDILGFIILKPHLRKILLFRNTSCITRGLFLGTFLRTNVRNNLGRYLWMRPNVQSYACFWLGIFI